MKTQLLSAVLISVAILTGSFAYSNDAKPVATSTKEIAIQSFFQKITLGSNLQLVLIQNKNRPSIHITGDENLLEAINVNIDKGVLSITSKKNLKNRKIKIYVPVSNLTSLELNSGASVATEGVVQLDDLLVLVHEGCKVNMNILGNSHVEAADDCDFVYEKYQKSNVVFIHD